MYGNAIALLLSIALLTPSVVKADDETVNTGGILSAALDMACRDMEVSGICIWMTCVLTACEFDYSVKTKHNIPEVIVTAYPLVGQSPWTDTASYAGPTSFAEEGGSSTEGGTTNREQQLRFKNSDVIGSPGAYIYLALAEETDYFCEPEVYGYQPYFLSTNDYNWRDPTAETGWTISNATAAIKKEGATFGGLFPRHGFVNQSHDYKASLVAAKRAADIVRQDYQPHVYWPITASETSFEQGHWPPGENTKFLWQQLVPEVEDCTRLPDIDDSTSVGDPYASRLNVQKGNAWQLWRSYSCCTEEGAILVFHTGE